MQGSLAAPRFLRIPGRLPGGDRSYFADPAWWTAFLAFTSLGFTQAGYKFSSMGGTLLPALFLIIWFGFGAAHPTNALRLLWTNRIPFALPLVALASTFWSQNQSYTMRTAFEFLLVVMVGIYAAGRVPPGKYISGLMLATFLQAVVSLAVGGREVIQYAGNEALNGIFGSKNYMGYVAATLTLLALATSADRRHPTFLRLVGVAGLGIGPFLALAARSADALVALAAGLAACVFVIGIGRLRAPARVLIVSATAVLLVVAVAMGVLLKDELLAMLLDATGKDTSLTGRTYLWYRAEDFLRQHRNFGVGYAAFWRQGNIDAEGLWRQLKIKERGGFHFHNLYYEVGVELGLLGLITWFTFIGLTFFATLWAALRHPSPETAFFFSFAVIIVVRMFVEVEMLGPFDIGPILFIAGWVYATTGNWSVRNPGAPRGAPSRDPPFAARMLRR